MSHGGPSVMESYNVPTSIGHSDYPGEQISGDTVVQGRDYRAGSVDYFKNQDSSGGTVVSYATSGYRSDHGATDIDFDDKQAYESIDRFQDRRVVANPNGSGKCPPPGEMPEVRIPGQVALCSQPDYVTKKGWISLRRCLCFSIILTVITLLIAVAGTAIAVYAFLTIFEGGRVLGSGTTTVATSDPTIMMLQTQLAESQSIIEELRTNFSVQQTSQAELSVQVATLLTPANDTGMTNTFDGCETEIVGSCIATQTPVFVNSNPAYSACNTAEYSLTRPGRAIVDIYCAVDNSGGEQNPLWSNLEVFNGAASCTCYNMHARAPTASITCNLHVKTCPA